MKKKKWYKHAHSLKKVWSALIFLPSGIILKVKREAELEKGKPYIFCPNHTSYLDIPTINLAVPGYYHYMGKVELLKSMYFGMFFRTMDIPVDRSSVISAHRAFVRAGDDLDNGVGVVIFPEGQISTKVPELLEFKPGAFRLAIKKKVPIVPISIIDNWKILPDGSNVGQLGYCRIVIHEPIETKDMSKEDIKGLQNNVYNTLNDTIKSYAN